MARWFDSENLGRGNVATATYRKLTTVRHAAVNKLVAMTVTAKLEDPSTAAKLLLDGRLGRDGDWGSPEVLRLGDSDLEAVIEMGVTKKIQRVVRRFFYCQEAGIYPASQVDVLVSDDGQTYTSAGTATFVVPQERGADGSSVKELEVLSGAEGRSVKVVCKNNMNTHPRLRDK